ncbi:MAG: putative zinc-binding metallopeptidase [Chthoniobacteraceae bacterium]
MNHFRCQCGNALFFENTACLQCGNAVGYDPADGKMRKIDDGFVRCRNGSEFGVCNWLVPAGGPAYCTACRLNRIVPDPSVPENLDAWRRMEAAKRRVVYTLARLGIPPVSKLERPDGLAFDFLAPWPGYRVMTGHENGVVTLNLLEADDSYRERERHRLGEPYRTLVGHFRHEVGHYYWDRFFQNRDSDDPQLGELRALFGDEREDYLTALARHYAEGPGTVWAETHITAYATSHPWEDWAETWAQYLHIVDGSETALAFGWGSDSVPIPFTPFSSAEVLDDPQADATFLTTLNGWAKLAPALNEIAASLGHATLYPFIFSPSAVRKIVFVHRMIERAAAEWQAEAKAGQVTTPVEAAVAA